MMPSPPLDFAKTPALSRSGRFASVAADTRWSRSNDPLDGDIRRNKTFAGRRAEVNCQVDGALPVNIGFPLDIRRSLPISQGPEGSHADNSSDTALMRHDR